MPGSWSSRPRSRSAIIRRAAARRCCIMRSAIALVRELTLASRAFFEMPPAGFSDVPLGQRMPVLVHARDDERAALDALDAERSRLSRQMERLDAARRSRALPASDGRRAVTASPTATASGSIPMRCCRAICASCAQRRRDRDRRACCEIERARWRMDAPRRSAATFIPRRSSSMRPAHGLTRWRACRRRANRPPAEATTIITFDAPRRHRLDGLPFAKTVGDELYFAPESGRLVRLADGRGAERSLRRPAGRI